MFNVPTAKIIPIVLGLLLIVAGRSSEVHAQGASLATSNPFGETLTPDIQQKGAATAEVGLDPALRDLSVIPPNFRDVVVEGQTGAAAGPASSSIVPGFGANGGGGLNFGDLGNPSAAPSGVLAPAGANNANSGVAALDPANDPDLNVRWTGDNKDVADATIANGFGIMGLGLLTVLSADPAMANTITATNKISVDAVGLYGGAARDREARFKDMGPSGETAHYSLSNCLDETNEKAAKVEYGQGKSEIPMRACRNPIEAGNSKGPNLLAGQGVFNSATQAKLARCGFDAKTASTPGVACRQEAQAVASGGDVIASYRMSYFIFPSAASGGDNEKKRTQFTNYFGDKCYVCMQGGKDDFGRTVSSSTVQRKVADIAPTTPIIENFKKFNETIYDNLRMVLLSKCKYENEASNPANSTSLKGEKIFRMNGDEIAKTWEGGSFWKSQRANTGADINGLSALKALGYLSFNGFRLSTAIVDALYQIVADKTPVSTTTYGTGVTASGTGLNGQCEQRLGANFNYQKVSQRLSTTDQGEGPLPKEIKSLYYFAQRLSVGRIYDGCEQVMLKVEGANILPHIGNDAIETVAKVCSGEVNDASAFGSKREDNVASLSNFVDKIFEQIAQDSGRSGNAVSKSFKGEKNLAAQGNLR